MADPETSTASISGSEAFPRPVTIDNLLMDGCGLSHEHVQDG